MISFNIAEIFNNDFSFEFFKILICTSQRKENERNYIRIFRLIFIRIIMNDI